MTGSPFKYLGALVFIVLAYTAPAPAQASNPQDFVQNMGDKAFASLSEEGLSQDQRTERFRGLLNESFDLPRIARFTLGRYWRTATDEEKTEFIALFEKFVIQAYSNRFQDMSGQKLNVINARKFQSRRRWYCPKSKSPARRR